MTENEAKREATFEEEYEILKKEKEELFAMEVCDTEPPFANCVVRRALRCIRKLLEEIQQYRAIGTIEEFKAFRSNDFTQDLLNMGYTKGHRKAIDEFAERLKSDEFQKYNLDMVFETSRNLSYSECIDAFHEYIDEIAEQMKAGGIE